MAKANKQQKQLSVRLTNDIRWEIAHPLLIRKYKSRALATMKEAKSLAKACYMATFSLKDRQLMDSAPDGFFSTRHDMFIATYKDAVESTYDYRTRHLKFSGSLGILENPNFDIKRDPWYGNTLEKFLGITQPELIKMRFPADKASSRIMFPFAHALGSRLREHMEEVSLLDKNLQEDKQKLSNTLKSFNTLKMLEEAWPELHPFTAPVRVYEGDHPTSKRIVNVPMIPVADLNINFGLPI